jgi:pre-mRNA-splicing factor RBM22/SLT11
MTRERNLAIKTGINKQGWEESDFPIACESCYGPSPFMRMLKERYGQECRICFRPFTVFKWKATKGTYKRTAICQNCSKTKNLCQTCLSDLEFGLPMEVRDRRCGIAGKALLD